MKFSRACSFAILAATINAAAIKPVETNNVLTGCSQGDDETVVALTRGQTTFGLSDTLDALWNQLIPTAGSADGIYKRDLGAILDELKLKKEKIEEALAALITGKLAASKDKVDDIAKILQISKSEAISLGLTEDAKDSDLAFTLSKALSIEISKSFSFSKSGKRDLGAILDELKLKKEKIEEALAALITGKLAASKDKVDDIAKILQISKSEAISLGLTEDAKDSDLAFTLSKALSIEISKSFNFGKSG
ncbi:uncharacterized protein LODBEIA_P15020 [Lodderomyces beijingensis]|uniref:Uncharacterized protein n=1 Tax=Lodderomyces beijingensis TaxID=1775926 RepID=A0ABP0ZI21_9ASCO